MPERGKALGLANALAPRISTFKVGPVLFLGAGPGVIRELNDLGAGVFLDLKFHDIPSTVEKSIEHVVRYGVKMFTVHSLGGLDMMRAVVERVNGLTLDAPERRPLVLAVTVLTSHDDDALSSLGIRASTGDEVLRLAGIAEKAGVDGLVASGLEAEVLRREFGDRFTLVVPGIRPGGKAHDQKRVATPAEAVDKGADYLVIGRVVTEAPEPEKAVDGIIAELTSL